MPYKEEMTWREKGARWVKKYRGKQHAISCRQLQVPPNKQASRDAANAWWKKKRAELDSTPPEEELDRHYSLAHDNTIKMLEWFKSDGDQEGVERMKCELAELSELAAEGQPHHPSLNPLRYVSPEGQAIWQERFRMFRKHSERTPLDRTIKAQIKTFLAHKQAQVAGKQRSLARWASIKAHLAFFSEWIGDQQPIDSITSLKLTEFYNYLVNATNISPIYKRDILVTTKSLIQFCYEHDLMELPKNLRSTNLSIRKGKRKIQTMPISQLRGLIDAAAGQTKLYLLLMANTGMQQKDISDLTVGQVKLSDKGKSPQTVRITRKRSKTEHHDEVPEVTYTLWPETAALLTVFHSCTSATDEDRWLVTAKGKPLVQEELRDGEAKRCDNIKSAYVRLLNKMRIPKGTENRKSLRLKLIRKTSASILERHPVFGRYANHFLADSPRSIPDSHYVVPDQKNFDDAVEWLRQQVLFEPSSDEAAKSKPPQRHRAKSK